jgi:hypothetical protein
MGRMMCDVCAYSTLLYPEGGGPRLTALSGQFWIAGNVAVACGSPLPFFTLGSIERQIEVRPHPSYMQPLCAADTCTLGQSFTAVRPALRQTGPLSQLCCLRNIMPNLRGNN